MGLLLTYINDLLEHTQSEARLSADDCLLFRKITKKRTDSKQLLQDLTSLQDWEQQWQMEFHPQKCMVIHISNKRQPIKTKYLLHGHTLEEVCSALPSTTSSNGTSISPTLRPKPQRPLDLLRGT
jgi:ribosomal protein L11 methylase PrmA